MVIGAGSLWDTPAPFGFRIGMVVMLLASSGFIFWLLYSTRYTLTERKLVVHCGPFRWTVMLDSIQEVFPSRNPLSSPACSLDRLHIHYRGSRYGLLISPMNKSAFLNDLVARSPGLRLEGGQITREQ